MLNYKKEIEELAALVIEKQASDLHLSAFRHPIIRTHGALTPLLDHPVLTPDDVLGLLFEIVDENLKNEFLHNKELDFSYQAQGGNRFRGNAYFQKGFAGIALRYIPKDILTLDQLNLPKVLEIFTIQKQGFFLAVGPVGHGKSTTLAAMIQMINTSRSEHILTIEDPIEYLFKEEKSIIDQREVRFDTIDFPNALRSLFREDVNVAMIGEMRDAETIGTAVTAAETGHLIFSTLHTNNAAQTVDRIIDSFAANQQGQIKIQLAATLLGIFSQRLVPRAEGGRVPAYELLINNNAVANLIREGRTNEINVVLETSSAEGMISMNHSLADLVRRGEVTKEDAIKYSYNPYELEKMI
jgi:twitching motility protein PilT